MLLDLFSSMDFSLTNFNIFNSSLSWIVGFLMMNLFLNSLFMKSKYFNSLFFVGYKSHYLNVLSSSLSLLRFSYLFFLSMFIFLILLNLWGLVPYIFGVTTQMVVSFSLSLGVWLTVVFSSFLYKMKSFTAHLTPEGAPLILVFLLKILELVSNMIRSLTLALRLSMNMSTGHIFMGLISTSGVVFGKLGMFFVLMMMGYILFEVGISLMQGFVFSLLGVQYLEEHV